MTSLICPSELTKFTLMLASNSNVFASKATKVLTEWDKSYKAAGDLKEPLPAVTSQLMADLEIQESLEHKLIHSIELQYERLEKTEIEIGNAAEAAEDLKTQLDNQNENVKRAIQHFKSKKSSKKSSLKLEKKLKFQVEQQAELEQRVQSKMEQQEELEEKLEQQKLRLQELEVSLAEEVAKRAGIENQLHQQDLALQQLVIDAKNKIDSLCYFQLARLAVATREEYEFRCMDFGMRNPLKQGNSGVFEHNGSLEAGPVVETQIVELERLPLELEVQKLLECNPAADDVQGLELQEIVGDQETFVEIQPFELESYTATKSQTIELEHTTLCEIDYISNDALEMKLKQKHYSYQELQQPIYSMPLDGELDAEQKANSVKPKAVKHVTFADMESRKSFAAVAKSIWKHIRGNWARYHVSEKPRESKLMASSLKLSESDLSLESIAQTNSSDTCIGKLSQLSSLSRRSKITGSIRRIFLSSH